jgi:hypothetical protein
MAANLARSCNLFKHHFCARNIIFCTVYWLLSPLQTNAPRQCDAKFATFSGFRTAACTTMGIQTRSRCLLFTVPNDRLAGRRLFFFRSYFATPRQQFACYRQAAPSSSSSIPGIIYCTARHNGNCHPSVNDAVPALNRTGSTVRYARVRAAAPRRRGERRCRLPTRAGWEPPSLSQATVAASLAPVLVK